MNRIIALVGVFTLAVIATSAAVAEEDKAPKFATKAFMKKFHGKEGEVSKLKAAIKGEEWEAATKISKAYFADAQKLIKVTPKKGDKEHWEKVANTFCKSAKTLVEATEAKEAKRANGALGAMGKTCGACHSKHK